MTTGQRTGRARAEAVRLASKVREARLLRGVSQRELAIVVGLTRQGLSAIEAGRSVPSTGVALQLARALDCRVEDLFVPEAPRTAPLTLTVIGGDAGPPRRLAVASVRGRWIAHSLDAARGTQESFVAGDGAIARDAAGAPSEVWRAPQDLERTALLLGCDPSLGILVSHLPAAGHGPSLRWLNTPSQQALDAVERGEAHVAGSHLPGDRDDDLPHARRALAGVGGVVIAFARWQQGFVVAKGDPKRITDIAALARPDVRCVNREVGSGSRALLDDLLGRAAIPPADVRGYDRIVGGHFAVARAVAAGAADVGIALEAAAAAFDLGFVPLGDVRFDLTIPADHLAHPAVRLLCDTLQRRTLRADLAMLPGYDVSETGAVVARIPASPPAA